MEGAIKCPLERVISTTWITRAFQLGQQDTVRVLLCHWTKEGKREMRTGLEFGGELKETDVW